MSGEYSLEEWGQRRSSASSALTWVKACERQIARWADAWRRFHPASGEPNWEASDDATADAYFLALASDRLRATLQTGDHRDLLALLPPPRNVEGSEGENNDGATYVRHVRNAVEHKDEKGLFQQTYGFGVGWTVGTGPEDASVNGIDIGPLRRALLAMHHELEKRYLEAELEWKRLFAVRQANEATPT